MAPVLKGDGWQRPIVQSAPVNSIEDLAGKVKSGELTDDNILDIIRTLELQPRQSGRVERIKLKLLIRKLQDALDGIEEINKS